jgi:hypothetical protein
MGIRTILRLTGKPGEFDERYFLFQVIKQRQSLHL